MRQWRQQVISTKVTWTCCQESGVFGRPTDIATIKTARYQWTEDVVWQQVRTMNSMWNAQPRHYSLVFWCGVGWRTSQATVSKREIMAFGRTATSCIGIIWLIWFEQLKHRLTYYCYSSWCKRCKKSSSKGHKCRGRYSKHQGDQINLSLLQIGMILEQLYYVLTQSLPVSQRAVQLAKRYK